MEIRQPTRKERETHKGRSLYGFVKVDGVECKIEKFGGWSRLRTRFLVLAPAGKFFKPSGKDKVRCSSLTDMRGKIRDKYLADRW